MKASDKRSETLAAEFEDSLIAHQDSDRANLLYEFVLDNLSFASMQDREDEITEAHRRTFDWIFDLPVKSEGSFNKDSFSQWLRNGTTDPIYWVNGKPGSGKSTLMRYLHEHRTTRRCLREWSGTNSLVIASFFFWISGTPEQRSQTGLLRSLLHQLLNTHRRLIPRAFPDLWAKLWATSTRDRLKMSFSWPLSQLTASLKVLLAEMTKQSKVCFFVDGLDELDGDHLDLIDIFKTTTTEYSSVKACLSSRPFPVFEQAFSSGPTMRLQDLTFRDMTSYVEDNFSTHPLVGPQYNSLPEVSTKLTNGIVTKADGVFLWVRLVVQFLLENWQERNTIFDATFQLRKLPTELDDLFEYFLFSCQPEQNVIIASEIFQLVRAKEKVLTFTKDAYGASLTLWELALADEELRDLALNETMHEATDEEISAHCRRAEACIEDCCGGLLQIHHRARSKRSPSNLDPQSLAKSKVSYIHRTARDYLMYSGVWNQLLILTCFDNNNEISDFDPHLSHLRSYILHLKLSFYPIERHRRLNEWWPDLTLAMTHGRFAGPSSGPVQHLLLDEMDHTLDRLWARRNLDPNDNWARGAFLTYEARGNTTFHDPFLSLATKFGLAQYLEAKLSAEDIPYKSGQPLLSYAVEFLCDRRKTIYPLSGPEIIRTLINAGHDPNQEYKDLLTKRTTTPWLCALRCVREADRRGWIAHYDTDPTGVQRWVEVLRVFVEEGGADPNALIVKDRWDASGNAVEIVEMILQRFASNKVEELRRVLMEKGGRSRSYKERERDDGIGSGSRMTKGGKKAAGEGEGDEDEDEDEDGDGDGDGGGVSVGSTMKKIGGSKGGSGAASGEYGKTGAKQKKMLSMFQS